MNDKDELERAWSRIAELNEIIVGDRPDLFHDSLIRGSRVSRMEECLSTLKAIVKNNDISEIHRMSQHVIDSNPEFGRLPRKDK